MSEKDEGQKQIEKFERSIEDIEEEIHEPVKELDPKEQQFALLRAITPMDRFQVGNALGLSDHKRRKMQRDENVERYMKYCQSKYAEKEFLDAHKKQNKAIRQQLFGEIMDRMFYDEDDIKDVYPEGATDKEKKEWRQRYAKFAKFKDIMKVWDKIDEMTKLDEGEATSRIDDDTFKGQMQEAFEEYYQKRQTKKVGDNVEVDGDEDIDQFAVKAHEEDIRDASFEEVKEDQKELEEESSKEDSEEASLEKFKP